MQLEFIIVVIVYMWYVMAGVHDSSQMEVRGCLWEVGSLYCDTEFRTSIKLLRRVHNPSLHANDNKETSVEDSCSFLPFPLPLSPSLLTCRNVEILNPNVMMSRGWAFGR